VEGGVEGFDGLAGRISVRVDEQVRRIGSVPFVGHGPQVKDVALFDTTDDEEGGFEEFVGDHTGRTTGTCWPARAASLNCLAYEASGISMAPQTVREVRASRLRKT